MNLLKQITNKQKQRFSIVRENDATGAGDVASVFAPLMGANTMIKRLNDAAIKKSVKKKTKRVKEQIGVADDFADFEQWVGACRKAGGVTFKSVNPENHDDGVRCYMVTNGKTIDVGYWADGHGEVTRYTAESKKLGLLGAYKDIVSEGALPGYKKWKAEMTAAGAVKFWHDQHGGGASNYHESVVSESKATEWIKNKLLSAFKRVAPDWYDLYQARENLRINATATYDELDRKYNAILAVENDPEWQQALKQANQYRIKQKEAAKAKDYEAAKRYSKLAKSSTPSFKYFLNKHMELTQHESIQEKMSGGQKTAYDMTAAGAVKFWRDQHGGGAVDHIVAYDKDGKVIGSFNRKAAVREGVIAEGGEGEFDQSSVISKLKALENKEKADVRDTVTFGIEDENNQVVRVTIRAEQAGEFEKALQAVMADMEEDENSKIEIAEVLFKLKDNFDIVDVVWPEIEEDEEVPRQQFGDEQGEPGAEGDGLEGLEGEGGEGDPLADLEDDGAGEESEVKGLLSQVIDMMKADAAARQADAEARIADAKAREQELGAKQALAKIKQEEQFLDMEEYEKKQKAQEKEAKRLAQLARWKSQMGSSGMTDAIADDGPEMGLPPRRGTVGMPGGEENEEIRRAPTRVAAGDLARKLMGRR